VIDLLQDPGLGMRQDKTVVGTAGPIENDQRKAIDA